LSKGKSLGLHFMKRYLPFIIVGAVAVMTLVGGGIFYRAKHPPTLVLPAKSAEAAPDTGAIHTRGNPKAAVTLEEYGDYQCPPCGTLAGPLKDLEHEYGDRLRVIFHHLPLIVHAHAKEAAWAAEAAALQGKFWEMHDLLYREQAVWSKSSDVRPLFAAYAGMIGLDVSRFQKEIESEEVKTRVNTDLREAAKIGVTGTPTLFVNNRVVKTMPGDVASIRAAIDEALKAKPPG
jgi:protein-disulfide isomerase